MQDRRHDTPSDRLARNVMTAGEFVWRLIVWGLILGVIGIFIYAALRTPAAGQQPKSVHVDGYYRNDGTYVRPHERRPPGQAGRPTVTTSPEDEPPPIRRAESVKPADPDTPSHAPANSEDRSFGPAFFGVVVLGLIAAAVVLLVRGRGAAGPAGRQTYRRPYRRPGDNPFE
jgi:hypothetical protein